MRHPLHPPCRWDLVYSVTLNNSSRAQFATPPPQPPLLTKNTSFRSDPYEYMRKARIGNGNGSSKNSDNNNVDDWQSCWVDEAEDARISRKDTNCSTFKAATATKQPPSTTADQGRYSVLS